MLPENMEKVLSNVTSPELKDAIAQALSGLSPREVETLCSDPEFKGILDVLFEALEAFSHVQKTGNVAHLKELPGIVFRITRSVSKLRSLGKQYQKKVAKEVAKATVKPNKAAKKAAKAAAKEKKRAMKARIKEAKAAAKVARKEVKEAERLQVAAIRAEFLKC